MKKTKILVVDDDAITRALLKEVLELKGYEIIISEKPSETEEIILNNNIDLLILDKMISEIDGTEVCLRVRNNEQTSKVKIMMLTAHHNAESKCLEAGADAFMTKPFDMNLLYKNIDAVLN